MTFLLKYVVRYISKYVCILIHLGIVERDLVLDLLIILLLEIDLYTLIKC